MKCALPRPLRPWLLLLLVAGCAGPQPQPDAEAPDQPARQLPVTDQSESAEALLRQAREHDDAAAAARLTVEALLVMEAEGDYTSMPAILPTVDTGQLDPRGKARLQLARAAWLLHSGAAAAALQALPQGEALTDAAERQLRWRLQAQAQEWLGQPLAAAGTRLELARSLRQEYPEQARNEQDHLWRLLRSLPSPGDLAPPPNLADGAIAELQAWLRLADVADSRHASLEIQQQAVTAWQRNHPDHAANEQLPSELAAIPEAIDRQPRQVALLLPLSGPLASAGKAIRDGYLASHFQALAEGGFSPRIRIYDSTTGDPAARYQEAVDAGAELVIGPLDRTRVAALQDLPEYPVAVLALNILSEASGAAPDKMLQFGLLPETDGAQLARGVRASGAERVILLGVDSRWSDRVLERFREVYSTSGGSVLGHARFLDTRDLGAAVTEMLLLDESRDRARALRQVLATTLEFEPRRRQDVDAVIVAAGPSHGGSVRPTLAYHYGGDLDVFASSQLYGGSSSERAARELDDIHALAIPWRVESSPLRETLAQHWPESVADAAEFYAMGVDAWHLQSRHVLLLEHDAVFAGATGNLQANNGRIQRQLSWMVLQRGWPRAQCRAQFEHCASLYPQYRSERLNAVERP